MVYTASSKKPLYENKNCMRQCYTVYRPRHILD